jgi:hypothetical protein
VHGQGVHDNGQVRRWLGGVIATPEVVRRMRLWCALVSALPFGCFPLTFGSMTRNASRNQIRHVVGAALTHRQDVVAFGADHYTVRSSELGAGVFVSVEDAGAGVGSSRRRGCGGTCSGICSSSMSWGRP